jgi:SEC-C motif-containing protein
MPSNFSKKMLHTPCYCGNPTSFSECCQRFISVKEFPETPEQLMRSRYSAYAAGEIDYLIDSTHPSTRTLYSPTEIERWMLSNKWLKLEIIKSDGAMVEFKAHFVEGLKSSEIHHERSTFQKENGRWYFLDGIHPNH